MKGFGTFYLMEKSEISGNVLRYNATHTRNFHSISHIFGEFNRLTNNIL